MIEECGNKCKIQGWNFCLDDVLTESFKNQGFKLRTIMKEDYRFFNMKEI